MRSKLDRRGSEEEDELPYADDAPAPPPILADRGYRVSGDIEVRVKQLEEELLHSRTANKALERDLWAARRSARVARASSLGKRAASRGGLGAAWGSLVALVLFFVVETMPAPILFGLVLAGAAIGIIADGLRADAEDDGFPPAPPPRGPGLP